MSSSSLSSSSSYDSASGITNQMILSGFTTTSSGKEELPKWNELAPMLEGRTSFAAVAIDRNRVMVIGGWNGYNRLKSVRVYDERNNQWTNAGWPDLNEERNGHSAVMCNNKIFVISGKTGDNINVVHSSSIEYLDLLSSSPLKWVTLEQTLSCGRSECAAVAVGSVIYIIGGYDGSNWLSSVEVFDTKTEHFYRDQPSMVSARSGCSAALIGNKIWVVGGYNQNDMHLKTIEYSEVNLDTGMPVGQWTMLTTNMTTERYRPSIAVVGHCLVIMGGVNNNNISLSSVEVLDTQLSVCWKLPDMSVPRAACLAVVLKESQVFAMGGYNNANGVRVHRSVESLLLDVKFPTCFELSESRCMEILSIDNIKPIVKWAHLLDADRLRNDCFKFIKDNAKVLFDNKDFFALQEEEPELWKCMLEYLF